ncbi:MAG: RNA polymerase sigma factor [Armatimonadota bacterium]
MRHRPRLDDRALLAALAQGDTSALDALYKSYSAPVYHFLLARTRSPEDAEDLLVEVFLSLMARGRKLTRIDNLLAYLLKIARHKAAQLYFSQDHLRLHDPDVQVVDPRAATAESRARATSVHKALNELPVEQCEVIVLKVWHQMTFAEIAEALHIPPNTAASRYRYGMDKLQALLGDDDDE